MLPEIMIYTPTNANNKQNISIFDMVSFNMKQQKIAVNRGAVFLTIPIKTKGRFLTEQVVQQTVKAVINTLKQSTFRCFFCIESHTCFLMFTFIMINSIMSCVEQRNTKNSEISKVGLQSNKTFVATFDITNENMLNI